MLEVARKREKERKKEREREKEVRFVCVRAFVACVSRVKERKKTVRVRGQSSENVKKYARENTRGRVLGAEWNGYYKTMYRSYENPTRDIHPSKKKR